MVLDNPTDVKASCNLFTIPISFGSMSRINLINSLNSMTRILFCGSDLFSVECLKQLSFKNLMVSTIKESNPLYLFAKTQNIPVVFDLVEADLGVVCSYPKLIPIKDFKMPFINAHPSLLPKYRGPSPIQYALLNEETTGVSIILLDKTFDTGNIIFQEQIDIATNDTFFSLRNKLAMLSGKLLNKTLKNLNENLKNSYLQSGIISYAPKIKKQEGISSVQNTAKEIYNKWRAFHHQAPIILKNRKNVQLTKMLEPIDKKMDPGYWYYDKVKKTINIATKNGMICVLELKPCSKRNMSALDYCNGFHGIKHLFDYIVFQY